MSNMLDSSHLCTVNGQPCTYLGVALLFFAGRMFGGEGPTWTDHTTPRTDAPVRFRVAFCGWHGEAQRPYTFTTRA